MKSSDVLVMMTEINKETQRIEGVIQELTTSINNSLSLPASDTNALKISRNLQKYILESLHDKIEKLEKYCK